MTEKRKHITIRPRVNSALERAYDGKREQLADLAHKWADADERGWLEQFNLAESDKETDA